MQKHLLRASPRLLQCWSQPLELQLILRLSYSIQRQESISFYKLKLLQMCSSVFFLMTLALIIVQSPAFIFLLLFTSQGWLILVAPETLIYFILKILLSHSNFLLPILLLTLWSAKSGDFPPQFFLSPNILGEATSCSVFPSTCRDKWTFWKFSTKFLEFSLQSKRSWKMQAWTQAKMFLGWEKYSRPAFFFLKRNAFSGRLGVVGRREKSYAHRLPVFKQTELRCLFCFMANTSQLGYASAGIYYFN